MIAALDSAYPPTAAAIAAAAQGGIKLWAGYLPGRNILNGWRQADFERVRAGGLSTLAYCSGYASPILMAALGRQWDVPICLDVEGGIRGDGSWVHDWLDQSGAGLYGNAGVFKARRARFYILAAYPGPDPKRTWPAGMVRPPDGPCGWQWRGSHSAFGWNVDSAWLDDEFANTRASGIVGSIVPTQEEWDNTQARVLAILHTLDGQPNAAGQTVHPTPFEKLVADVAALKTAAGGGGSVDLPALAKAVADELQRRLQA